MSKLKEIYIKSKAKLVIAFSLLVLIVALMNIYTILEVRVTSNDECLWVANNPGADSSAIHFESVKVSGVTWKAGIRDSDLLLEINGNPIKTTSQAQLILNKVNSGEYANYVVKKKDGTILKTKVQVKKLIQFQLLAIAILGIIWLSIGFIVLMARQGSVQKIFYLTGVTAVLMLGFLLIPQQSGAGNFLRTVYLAFIVAAWCFGISFFSFFLMYFFWIFPRPFKFIQNKTFKRIYFGIPTTFAVLFFVFIFFFSGSLKGGGKLINSIVFWLNILLGIGTLVGCISLIINYRRLKTKKEKQPVLAILISYLLAVLAIIYTVQIAPAITDTIFNSPEFYTPIILIIILPISFAYSIFKYQLMDVSVVVKNTIIYGAATLTLAAFYFLIIYVIGQGISEAIGTAYKNIIAGVFFISFALIFQSTKDKFQDFLTAKFYPEQFAYQKVLMKYSSEVASIVGLENILESTKTTLVDALMINHFGIMIRYDDKKKFVLVKSVGIENQKLILRNTELTDFIKNKIFPDNRIVIERDDFANVFPVTHELLLAENIFTIIPMIIKSEVVGLLLFGLKHSGAQFAGKDLDLLLAAASQAAVSIENARLYELEVQKQKIERDLELAKRIQQGLLPRCIPEINGLDICGEMIPAMQVGGDYFDLIEVSDKKIFVVVGDVSGKGLSASLYMAKLQTMMQLYCTDNKSPKEILTEVNRRLYLEMEKSWFVTLVVALFDTETGKITFCRAGHVPVLITSNGNVNFYRTKGLGVGLEKGPIFEKSLVEEKIDLKSGQTFAFFSDGVTEAMNEKDELFGEERLGTIFKNKEELSSSTIMDRTWTELKSFQNSAPQYDDMTMVLVKVK